MTPSRTFNTGQCYCYKKWHQQPYLTIGDFSISYIDVIYTNLYLHKYKTDEELKKKFLHPSEEMIIDKIIPTIVAQYKKDTIFNEKDRTRNTSMNLYNYFIHNENYKMSEQERRRRYKEEFTKALNKDLLKPE